MFFEDMCAKNSLYLATGGDCQQGFLEYRLVALAAAQSAFLITIVWGPELFFILLFKYYFLERSNRQCIDQKDPNIEHLYVSSLLEFHPKANSPLRMSRLFDNKFMLGSILAEIIIIIFVIYTPRVDSLFQLVCSLMIRFFFSQYSFSGPSQRKVGFLCHLDHPVSRSLG